MIDGLSSTTADIVKLALDAAVQKHNIISNNIANANTAGFQPQTLGFEEELSKLIKLSEETSKAGLQGEIDGFKQSLASGEFVVPGATDKVELDVEVKELTENVIRYRALLEGLSKRGSIIKMAIE